MENLPIVYPKSVCIVAVICAVLFIIFGVLGNSLSIIALLKDSKLRKNTTTLFVVSLSITDLVFCAFNLPLTASRYLHRTWIWSETLCEVFPFLFYLNVATSLFHLMCISINRFVLIVYNRFYDRVFTTFKSLVYILFLWMVPLTFLAPIAARKWGAFGYRNHTFSCTILKVDGKSPKKFIFLFGVLIPCLVIASAYASIFYTFRKNAASLAIQAKRVAKKKAEENALTKTILVLFIAFLMCYIPLMLVNVLDKNDDKVPSLHVLGSILAWSASIINPFVYVGLNKRYRQAFLNLLGRKSQSPSSSRNSASTTRLSFTATSLSNVRAVATYSKKEVEEA